MLFGACCLWVETLLSLYFLYVPPRYITPRYNEAEQCVKVTAKLINNLSKLLAQGTAAKNITKLRK